MSTHRTAEDQWFAEAPLGYRLHLLALAEKLSACLGQEEPDADAATMQAALPAFEPWAVAQLHELVAQDAAVRAWIASGAAHTWHQRAPAFD